MYIKIISEKMDNIKKHHKLSAFEADGFPESLAAATYRGSVPM